jgi:hypothetical protein
MTEAPRVMLSLSKHDTIEALQLLSIPRLYIGDKPAAL